MITVDVRDENAVGPPQHLVHDCLIVEVVHELRVGALRAVHQYTITILHEIDGRGAAGLARPRRHRSQKQYLRLFIFRVEKVIVADTLLHHESVALVDLRELLILQSLLILEHLGSHFEVVHETQCLHELTRPQFRARFQQLTLLQTVCQARI